MTESITKWEKMKEGLIARFGPQDETLGARAKVKFMKQRGTLQAHGVFKYDVGASRYS